MNSSEVAIAIYRSIPGGLNNATTFVRLSEIACVILIGKATDGASATRIIMSKLGVSSDPGYIEGLMSPFSRSLQFSMRS